MKSKRVIISLKFNDYLKLKALAEKERLSVSALVRHFIIRKIYPNEDGRS
jgi:hypothetical protein